jgi:HPt (histidine-containing phosphotransfer) domain-containing protein
MKIEKPKRVSAECNSLETHEMVESRKMSADKTAPIDSAEEQPDPPGVVLDSNTLEQILAIERQGSSSNLLEKLINSYLDNTPELLKQLQEVAHHHNPQGLRETAHRLKSSSANLGAQALAKLCNELEVMAQANSTENAVEMTSRIKSEYEKVRLGLTEVLKTRNAAEP